MLRSTETVIAFERPRRVGESLAALAAIAPDRPAAVCRELTKMHEEVARGSLGELARRFRGDVKGEIVLVIGPAASAEHDKDVGFAVDALRHLVQSGARPRAARQRRRGAHRHPRQRPLQGADRAARRAGDLLRHHPDLLRQRGASPRARLLDDGRRHARPAHRQRGEDVFFLTGTDEHGEPIETAAAQEGISPQELADRNAAKFEALMPIIDATNDFFIRTSDPRHEAKVAEIMQRVYDNGWVRKGVYEGWYCPRCADFKTERELGGGQHLPDPRDPAGRGDEENWFFRLSKFQGRLEALYEEQPDFVVPDFRRNEAVSFIKGGLEDVSLSRPTLKWGMPLPWDPEQRMYVWFDALLNYVTALTFARPGEDLTERYWPADLHVMAKDILKFHAVIWPALCMAAGLEPPRRMAIHGYLLMGEKKMSKSLGNVLDPFVVIDRFGADALRFYLFREVSFGQDGSISTAGFEARYETELANDYGNLASRTLAMVDRYRAGIVPRRASSGPRRGLRRGARRASAG